MAHDPRQPYRTSSSSPASVPALSGRSIGGIAAPRQAEMLTYSRQFARSWTAPRQLGMAAGLHDDGKPLAIARESAERMAMRAVRFDDYGPAEALYVAEVDTPVPGEGELLV